MLALCSTVEIEAYERSLMLPVRLADQLQAGTFEYTVNYLVDNEDRVGTWGKPVKSNITNNESATMPSSHGVIQGYIEIATVDEKHQIIVDAQAFREANEARHVEEVIDSIGKTFRGLDKNLDIL